MWNFLVLLIQPPKFSDDEKTRIAEVIHYFSLTAIIIAAIGTISVIFLDPQNHLVFLIGGFFFAYGSIAQYFLRKGNPKTSAFWLIGAGWLVTSLMVLLRGGFHTPLTVIYFALLIVASMVLGGKATAALSVLTIVATAFMVILENLGLLPQPIVPQSVFWLIYSLVFILTSVILHLSTRSLRQAIMRARSANSSLVETNQALEKTRQSLEKIVSERTASLEKRTQYLEATLQVGRVAATILDAHELAQTIVDLIRDRFELYYVGLFLVDQKNEEAILQAGTGEAGQTLVSRGHFIKVGSGMIGWSIANAQPRVAMLASEDSVRLSTPELPETRAEAALPLISHGHVIGALTVQSRQPGIFDETLVAVLQSMAEQVATALANARLFAENQEALENTRQMFGEISQQGWANMLRNRPGWGFQLSNGTISSPQDEWQAELSQAAQSGKFVQAAEDGKYSLAAPILVRNQPIGALGLRKKDSSVEWTDEELSVLRSVLDQLGQALESARLYDETQRKAERERIASQITARIRSSNDPQTILQTAVMELRRALQVDQAQILIQPNKQEFYPSPVKDINLMSPPSGAGG